MPRFRDGCCNPMNLDKHLIKTSLRKISQSLAVRYNLSTDERICSGCHQKLLHPKPVDCSGNSDPETFDYSTIFFPLIQPTTSFEISPIQQSCSSLSELSLNITIPSINQALSILNQSMLWHSSMRKCHLILKNRW
ncbi:hypothetical protein PV327_001634 [Microctonus hyperodae]|uniref:Uncharacterized protein n=1 Tax=Microctonus hyperodae TaxID=165561 RepID=A0AA39KN96_MICHY|nr:hypothetical protein PV327_001634 [Microctonus hyperodae]